MTINRADGIAARTRAQLSSALALSTTMTWGTPAKPDARASTQWALL
jgi:hypothetical protein